MFVIVVVAVCCGLRSGREHLGLELAVEVRQGTLGAGNTRRGWSWLRSGREHWTWMVVVEVRRRRTRRRRRWG